MGRRSTPSLLTIASSVYDQLRKDILSGALPPGQKLRIEPLRQRYQAGISPIREALNRLSAEGLVDRREQRGFYVIDTSDADLDELVKTRCWLEEIALRESMARSSSDWRESLIVLQYRLSQVPRSASDDGYSESPEWDKAHREFHRALISRCGSARLIRYCEDMADHAYRYRKLSIQRSLLTRDVHSEHGALVQAILDGDADRAVALLIQHYQRTGDIVQGRTEADTFDAAA